MIKPTSSVLTRQRADQRHSGELEQAVRVHLRSVIRVAGRLQAERVQALVGHAQHGHVAPVPLQRLARALARVRGQMVAAGERAHAHLPQGCMPPQVDKTKAECSTPMTRLPLLVIP